MKAKLTFLTLVAALVFAGPAAADSLTFIKGHNVWLANPDGSGQYQVTLDGTAGAPYESPSQADNGTVVALREAPGERTRIYRMTQSGGLLNAPINTPAPGTGAMHAKVSPSGALVSYWFLTLVNSQSVPVLRVDRGSGAAEPLGSLYEPQRARESRLRRLAILDRERHDSGRGRQFRAVVLQARDAGRGPVVL